MTASDLARGTEASQILPQEVRDQLNRILGSSEFRASARRKAFLQYVVEEYLAGRHERLKGFAIAVSVFDRDEKFDPQVDPIVRLEAGRLRRDLEHYYLAAGQFDPIVIDLPKGAYVPVIKRSESISTKPVSAPDVWPPEMPSTGHDAAPRATTWKRAMPLAAGVTALSLAAIAASLWTWKPNDDGMSSHAPSTASRAPASSTPERMLSVAVIPFAMVNGSTEDKYFAEGLSQEVAKSLSRFQSISVVAPSSIVAAAGGQSGNARAALGVNYFVEGTVEKVSDTVRVSARLVNSVSSRLIWAESYQRELDPRRIFEIREDISFKIAATIGSNHGILALSSVAETQKAPEHLDSFDCVLQYYRYNIAGLEGSHLRVRACLEQAVERDPGYAAAWASLANVYAQEYRLGFNPAPHRHPAAPARALRAAERAVELAPGDATASLMLANVYFDHEEYAGFRRMGEAAIRLSPGDPDLLVHYGMRLGFMGEWERGMSLVQRGIDVSVSHPAWYHYPVAFHHYLHGDYEQALSAAEKARPLGLFGYDLFAAMCFAKLNQPERAREAAGKLVAAHPNTSKKFWDLIRAWKFRPEDAEKMADGLRKAGVAVGSPTDATARTEAVAR